MRVCSRYRRSLQDGLEELVRREMKFLVALIKIGNAARAEGEWRRARNGGQLLQSYAGTEDGVWIRRR